MEHKVCTDFLFAKSSFLTGAASAINVPGNFYDFNYSSSGEEADLKAIKRDWMMTGQDMEIAMTNVVGNLHKKPVSNELVTQ